MRSERKEGKKLVKERNERKKGEETNIKKKRKGVERNRGTERGMTKERDKE